MRNMTEKGPSETVPGTILIFFNADREYAKFKLLAIDMSVNNNDLLWCDRTGPPKRDWGGGERVGEGRNLESREKSQSPDKT